MPFSEQVFSSFHQELIDLITRAEQQGVGREALTAMATAMQYKLMRDGRGKIYPYSSSLELIMRACCAALQHGNFDSPPTDPGQSTYIKSKLGNGVANLLHDVGIHDR